MASQRGWEILPQNTTPQYSLFKVQQREEDGGFTVVESAGF
jgi:hypothetical protein